MKPSYRPFRIVGTVGLAALALSTAGAIFALTPNGAKGQRTPEPTTGARPGAPVVCYGTIDVEPGVLPLYPMQAGRVIDVPVHENQNVKKGAVLLRLDNRLAKSQLDQAKADADAAEADLALARKLTEQLAAKTAQQQAAIDAATHELHAAERSFERKKQLEKDKLLNPLEVAAAEELVNKAKAAVRAEEARMRELKLTDPKLQIDRAEAQAAAKKAQLDKAQLALDEDQLLAPTDGQVLQVFVGAGSLLAPDPRQPALYFAPAGPRIVRAEIEQEFANRLVVGQSVKIQDEYGNGPERPGKVARIADWYTRSRMQVQDPMRALSSDVRTLECIVTMEPGQPGFRLGQRVRVKSPGDQ
jgi:multidrug resistance efflux pump